MSRRQVQDYGDLDLDGGRRGPSRRDYEERRRSRSPPSRRQGGAGGYRGSRDADEREYRDRRPDVRDRDRDRDRDQERERERRREDRGPARRRSRSPPPARRRDRSPPGRRSGRDSPDYEGSRRRARSPSPPPPAHGQSGSSQPSLSGKSLVDSAAAEHGEEGDDAAMMAMMGFAGFGSTAGQHVAGNSEVGAVSITEQRQYRQYMNRAGGFNRPLDKMD